MGGIRTPLCLDGGIEKDQYTLENRKFRNRERLNHASNISRLTSPMYDLESSGGNTFPPGAPRACSLK